MKHLLLKSMMLVLMLFVGMGAWAQSITPYLDNVAGSAFSITNNNKNSGTVVANQLSYSAPNATYSSPQWRLPAGESVTFTVTTGYKLDRIIIEVASTTNSGNVWTANNGTPSLSGTTLTVSSINNKTTTLTTGAKKGYMKSVKVYYVKDESAPTYTLTFANNAQGTFSAKVDGKTVTSGSKVEAGKTVTLTAEPKDGYVFNSWNVYKTANQYNYVTVAPNNTFTMPSEAVTVDAYFVEGKTIPNAEVSLAAGTYRGAQSVTITNLDESEYSYYYTLDGTTPEIDGGMNPVGTTQEYTGAISITESCTLSILTTDLTDSRVNTFEYVIEYPYTVTIEEPVNGTLTVMYGETPVHSGDQFYKGEVITATATPADGYKFRNLIFTDGSTHAFTASNVKVWDMGASDVTIKANFDEIQYYTVAFSVNGRVVQSDVLEENTAVTAPAVSDINGKKFMGWVKSTVVVDPATAPAYETISKATEDVTYVAVFATETSAGSQTEYKLTESKISNNLNSSTRTYADSETTYDDGDVEWGYVGYTQTAKAKFLQIRNTSPASYVSFETPENIKNIAFGVANGSGNNFTGTIYVKTSADATSTNADANKIASIAPNGKSGNVDITGNYTKLYIQASATARITSITLTCGTNPTYDDFTTTIPPTTITIGQYGYATFVAPCDLDFSEADVTAYSVTPNLAENKVTLTPQTEVPAGKAIVVKGTQGTHDVPAMASAADFVTALEVSATATAYDNVNTYYYLGQEAGVVGFRPLAEGGSIKAGKCFFKVANAPAGAPMLTFSFDDDETGITSVESAAKNGQAFNLAGQRVNANAKGIIIVNGKKYFNK